MAEEIIIPSSDDGQRLDRWIKKKFPEVSFGQMQKILRTGQVRVDGKRVKGDARLQEGQSVRIPPQLTMPAPKTKNGLLPKEEAFIQSLVIYKDNDLIAINKPAGLAVQGGSKIKRHVDGMLDGLRFGADKPMLVHRLDKETSGILLLARNTKTARILGDMFKDRSIRKYYWAVTDGVPELHQGKIQTSLAKVMGPDGERVMSVGRDEGKTALSFYTVVENVGDKVAWIAFWPKTGRTHQLRVHAAEIGCPILGDEKYTDYDESVIDDAYGRPEGLHLHARRLIMQHPVTGKKIDITAPLGDVMLKTFKYFGFSPNDKSDPFEDID